MPSRRIARALKILVIMGIATGAAMGAINKSTERKASDTSISGEQTLTKNDLETIRSSAIAYFQSTKHEFRDTFIAELKRGAIFLEETPSVGIWGVKHRAGKLALVRQPPVSKEMIYFGVYLVKKQGGWVVTGDFEEREQLDFKK